MKRQVVLNLEEDDCLWLEKVYGDTWTIRMEQHIENEVRLRSRDEGQLLKMRKPWDY